MAEFGYEGQKQGRKFAYMKEDIFHILNRGVEKREVFLDDKDYLRFVYSLYDFNDKNWTPLSYCVRRKYFSAMRFSTMRRPKSAADELVDILCWCMMPNHYHNLVQEKIDGGASSFSKKLSGGYTQYFNLKNDRSGVLFQGRSKIIPVQRDEHFMHLPFYIFSNPIKLVEPQWKEGGIKDIEKVIKFIENYKWSSYPSILGKENCFSFIINKKLFFELFDTNEKKFRQEFINWLNDFVK